MQLIDELVFDWTSQVMQYPTAGEPGIGYFAGEMPDAPPVDCLLWRDERGAVRGILNHYPVDYPPLERAGNIMFMVDPVRQRRGIATVLLTEAVKRWSIDFEQQTYTPAGFYCVLTFLSDHDEPSVLPLLSELARVTGALA